MQDLLVQMDGHILVILRPEDPDFINDKIETALVSVQPLSVLHAVRRTIQSTNR